MKKLLVIFCLLISIPSFASDPWDGLLVYNKKVSINFKNSNAHLINNWFTKATGIPVLMDPSFNKPITLDSPNKLSISECFKMYNQMLNFYNYEISKENKWLVIKPVVKKSEPIKPNNPAQAEDQQTEIRVIQLKNNNSNAVAKLINELFSVPSFKIEEGIGRLNQNVIIR